MKRDIRSYLIYLAIAVAVIVYRDPIITFAKGSIAEVKGWFGSIEAKPRQSQRISELEQTMDTSVEQASDDF